MRTRNLIGTGNQEMDTRRANAAMINAYIELDHAKNVKRIRRTEGLKPFIEVGSGPIRGLFFARNELFICSGSEAFVVRLIGDEYKITKIGDINSRNSFVSMQTNGSDSGEVMFVNGGQWWLWNGSELLPDSELPSIAPDNSVAVLNQRFYINNQDSNVFRASTPGDGAVWPDFDKASADVSPDPIRYIVAVRNNLIVINSRSTEYWQQIVTPQGIPVRRVVGATNNRGIAATFSVAQYEDKVFWLADDYTVVMQQGGNQIKISDAALEQAIRGSDYSKPYAFPERAEGFFIDDTLHKVYVLTFPDADATWCYDMTTKIWHRRKSWNIGRWRARTSINAFGRTLCGDYATGKIWELDRNRYTEGDNPQELIIESQGVYGQKGGLFISELEIVMDVGIGTSNNLEKNLTQNWIPTFIPPTQPITRTLPIEPLMRVAVSRNGGFSWTNRKAISLGRIGQRHKKVIDRRLGYISRHAEFMVRITISDDVPVNIYAMYLDVEEGS